MDIKNILGKMLHMSMQAVYTTMKLWFPKKDKVVFISRQSDTPSADFVLLADKIKELSPSTETVFSCKLGLKSEMGVSYIPLLLRQMRLLASARACITESYAPPISMLTHRPGMTVTQIWHSMVAIKQFGWQTVDTPEGSSSATARLMCMHRGYDHIIAGSEYMISFFAEAMDTDSEKILPLGAPHADTLLSIGKGGTRAALEEKYPSLRGKRIIVYLPTMRRGEAVPCAELARRFNLTDSVLIVKPHPLDSMTQAMLSDGNIILDTDTPTADLICAADAVISDYSGAAADASVLNIPVYFYIPDIDRYSKRCGINLDPRREFPLLSFTDASALIEALGKKPDAQTVTRERELLAGGCDGHSTERIAQLVLFGKDGLQ